jgi:uncharacterized protein (DUF1501 family)
MDRRNFVKTVGLATLAAPQWPTLASTPQAGEPIVVLLFLRGGVDALHLCAPTSDRAYADARSPNLRAGEKPGLALKNPLGGLSFHLHEAAKPLQELYDSNQLAIVHACGLTNGTRSHFEAMDLMERGLAQKRNTDQGWLARCLAARPPAAGQLPAVAMGDALPLAWLGSPQAVSLSTVADFAVGGDPKVAGILRSWYQQNAPLDRTAQQTLQTARLLQAKLPRHPNGEAKKYQPGTAYPTEWFVNGLSEQLKNLAQLIKLDLGVQVATVDFGGWDTHEAQAYHFPQLVGGLARAVAAFYNDLSAYHPRLTVLVMSEFGRRLKANRSGGTDHGLGGAMLLLGQGVRGGRMYGTWPGLATEQLDNGVDLAVTTDYRTVLGELAAKRLGNPPIGDLFPGFAMPVPLGLLV